MQEKEEEKEEEIKKREIEYSKLEEELKYLVDIFKDVQDIVNCQAPIIDSIETNITFTREEVKIAKEEIFEASSYQTKTMGIVGGTVGFFIAGPIGLLIGSKIGLIGMGVCGGITAIAGGFVGYNILN
jgi:hypothetical protein